MSEGPDKLSRFWQELKRRKVTRVITVYAASAFVILELLSIIIEPLRLPDWTLQFAIVFLCIGFVIAIIFSWIYDIHPEEGIVKTEPAHEMKGKDVLKSSNSWKIASLISLMVIVGLILLNIIPRFGKKVILDKSIAVLPFIDDSPDKDNEHIINGIMEDLLINMQSIKDLRVLGRTSTEKYRNHLKSIPEIAGELNVAYIIEGSGQRYGDKIRLRIQLVEGSTDRHIWADSYDEVINGPEDIFRIQSQLALKIAGELEAFITPLEKQRIEKVPTTSLTAYNYYQRGREEYLRNWVDNRNKSALDKAEELFLRALELDSSFALAYVGLAKVYWAEQGFRTYLAEDYLDSMLVLCDLALSYDDQLAEAYTLKGFYYSENGNIEQAVKEFDNALKYNPNDWETYRWKGRLYYFTDIVEYISNYTKAVSLNHDSELPSLLRLLAAAYEFAGILEKYNFYNQEAFKLDGDSIQYYNMLAFSQQNQGNFVGSAELLIKAYEIDTSHYSILIQIGLRYMYAGQFEEMLNYFKKFYSKVEASGGVNVANMHRLGYAYWMNGYKEEADFYFDKMIEYYENLMKQERELVGAYYDLAGVHAFRGEKEKAIEYLRIVNQQAIFGSWWVELFRRDPLFDSIRDEPEFQQILQDVQTKYQAEHERVRQWLEDNETL